MSENSEPHLPSAEALHELLENLVSGPGASEFQVLVRVLRDGQPTIIVGAEPEDFEPERDEDYLSYGGLGLIARERIRQMRVEGWSPEHDAQHTEGQLVEAAISYALPEDRRQPRPVGASGKSVPAWWPWEPEYWKPGNRVRELVKAGALISAEIDRLMAIDMAIDQDSGEV